MSITINIATVDRTANVEYQSVQLSRAISSQVDTLKFDVIRDGGDAGAAYKPTILDDVEIIEGSTTIFGGQIVEIESVVTEGSDIERFVCTAKDYSFDMDKSLVVAVYQNQTVDDIIDDINTNFLPAAYDITNVNCPIIVKYIAFNYEQPSKCFQQLAELTGYDWYVDEDKKIYFFSKTDIVAPFDLDDDSGNYYFNTLKLKSDLKGLRNSIIVRGGSYLGTTTAEKQVADGTTTVFLQGNQYNSIYVKVAGATKTVGINFITDPTTVDCLYDFNNRSITFPTASKPTAGQEVEVGGLPYIPVIVKVKDPVSVAQYGEFQYKIIDKSINTKEGARDRAKAEIANWAQSIEEGSFETMTAGLEVGQRIRISSVIRGIDQYYVISRINSRLINGTEFVHTVTLMTTQTYGMIEFLQKMLMSKDKEIEINENEVVDEIESVNETITLSEVLATALTHNPISETATIGESNTVQALDYAVEFVLGNYDTPTGTKREFCLNGSPLA